MSDPKLMKAAVLPILLLLTACSDPAPDPNPTIGVAKICRDGSHIYESRDGTYHTQMGYHVKDIEKVCG